MIKIKLPRSLKIGALRASVGLTPNIKLDDGWRACFNERTGRIHVDPAGGETIDRSYLHEVIHLIDINYGVGLDEGGIDRMANGLAEYLFENLGITFDWSDITCREYP